MFTCQECVLVAVSGAAGPAPARGSLSLETRPRLPRPGRGVACAAATLAPENPLAVSPATPLAEPRYRLGVRRYSRHVPIDPAVVLEYATRTFWALLVLVVTLLLARVVRRTTMRALTRGRAQ